LRRYGEIIFLWEKFFEEDAKKDGRKEEILKGWVSLC
jgi:hypothetical protein